LQQLLFVVYSFYVTSYNNSVELLLRRMPTMNVGILTEASVTLVLKQSYGTWKISTTPFSFISPLCANARASA